MNLLDLSLRAQQDLPFRTALLEHPRETLAGIGMGVPDEVEIEVVQSTPQHLIIALPPVEPSVTAEDGEMDEAALAGVAGGRGGMMHHTWEVGKWLFGQSSGSLADALRR